jgi:hypothetical protein
MDLTLEEMAMGWQQEDVITPFVAGDIYRLPRESKLFRLPAENRLARLSREQRIYRLA